MAFMGTLTSLLSREHDYSTSKKLIHPKPLERCDKYVLFEFLFSVGKLIMF